MGQKWSQKGGFPVKKIAVLTSGGDAPGMNAAIRAVVRASIYHELKIVGVQRGYTGLIQGAFTEMNLGSVADIIHRGGTVLHTARCKEFLTPEGRAEALGQLKKQGIEGLIVIGGDGSFRGALELHKLGFPVIGIPGTIDNDIAFTEYTIGFDTALNTVLDALNKIRDTATSHERIFIIEVMGRKSGWIAMEAGLAGGAESILVPEAPVDIKEVCRKIERGLQRGKRHNIIIVAEGAGNAHDVSKAIENETGLDTRISILGHIQRGGNPTALDRIIASRMSARAVELLLLKKSGLMVGIVGGEIINKDLETVLSTKKELDLSTYNVSEILSI